jgi:hypothetical protein
MRNDLAFQLLRKLPVGFLTHVLLSEKINNNKNKNNNNNSNTFDSFLSDGNPTQHNGSFYVCTNEKELDNKKVVTPLAYWYS